MLTEQVINPLFSFQVERTEFITYRNLRLQIKLRFNHCKKLLVAFGFS